MGGLTDLLSKEKSEDHKGSKMAKWITALGLLGMALIFLSTFLDATPKVENEAAQAQQYIEQTQRQLTALLEKMEGVGKATVMVTLEGGIEYEYAKDEKQSVDETSSYREGNPEKTQKKEDTQSSYIFVDSGANRRALVLRQLQPQIKGVVVVCQGAASPIIQSRVTQAVRTALGISSAQICVIPATG